MKALVLAEVWMECDSDYFAVELKKSGFSERQFAGAIGKSPAFVGQMRRGKFVNGRRLPVTCTPDTAARVVAVLSEAVGRDVGYIFSARLPRHARQIHQSGRAA